MKKHHSIDNFYTILAKRSTGLMIESRNMHSDEYMPILNLIVVIPYNFFFKIGNENIGEYLSNNGIEKIKNEDVNRDIFKLGTFDFYTIYISKLITDDDLILITSKEKPMDVRIIYFR